jgi:hypothetical protein
VEQAIDGLDDSESHNHAREYQNDEQEGVDEKSDKEILATPTTSSSFIATIILLSTHDNANSNVNIAKQRKEQETKRTCH